MLLRKFEASKVIIVFKDEFSQIAPDWESGNESEVLCKKLGLNYIHNDSGPAIINYTHSDGKEKSEKELKKELTDSSLWKGLLEKKEIEFSLNGEQYLDLDEWKRDAGFKE